VISLLVPTVKITYRVVSETIYVIGQYLIFRDLHDRNEIDEVLEEEKSEKANLDN
jgi:hypothetical protein